MSEQRGRSKPPPRATMPWDSASLATPTPPPPSAQCARCACNLSRYRDAWEAHCQPCTRVLVTEGQLTLPPFEPEWQSAAEEARAAVTTSGGERRCTRCDAPLAKGNNKTGQCLTCHKQLRRKAAAAREARRVCDDCGDRVHPKTWRQARNEDRPARCQVCASNARYHEAA